MRTVVAPVNPGAAHERAALPAEWHTWAEEPGQAVRIEEDGAVLGVIHVVLVGRTEAWLEGLWVHPAVRRRGIGRRLIAEAAALARGHGATVVRAAVPAHDGGGLAVGERTGFAKYCGATVLVARVSEVVSEPPTGAAVSPAAARETRVLVRLLEEAVQAGAWRGLVPLGWRFRRLVPELVTGLIKDGRVLRTGSPPQGAALFALRDEWAIISVLAGPPAHRDALFGAVVEEARMAGASRLALFVPSPGASAGVRAAFAPHPWCPHGLVVMQKALAEG